MIRDDNVNIEWEMICSSGTVGSTVLVVTVVAIGSMGS